MPTFFATFSSAETADNPIKSRTYGLIDQWTNGQKWRTFSELSMDFW